MGARSDSFEICEHPIAKAGIAEAAAALFKNKRLFIVLSDESRFGQKLVARKNWENFLVGSQAAPRIMNGRPSGVLVGHSLNRCARQLLRSFFDTDLPGKALNDASS